MVWCITLNWIIVYNNVTIAHSRYIPDIALVVYLITFFMLQVPVDWK